MAGGAVRVRFAPSPTGYLHVGGARTALFNWLLARKSPGGRFILRIEDTDRSRHVEDSVAKIIDDMLWLGLDWDEGPAPGGGSKGDHGPYFQSERLDIYEQYARKLLESGRAYYALETPEQLAAMREQAQREKKGDFKYPRPDPLPTIEQGEAAKKRGEPVVIRLRMPDEDIAVEDDILGRVVLTAAELEDFVIVKGDGWPTYHFACVVDDALMEVTHVLRGQEHLMNTPKHIALQRALGFPTPRYGHLPIIFNMAGGKMSKREKEKALARGEAPPEIDVHDFRSAGYLPEALLNFISLLGWSPGDGSEQMTLQETAGRFEVSAIGKSNAKFDRDKLLAFNTDWAGRVSAERLTEAFRDYLGVNESPLARLDDAALGRMLELCRGFRTFADVVTKAGFIYADDDAIAYDEQAVRKVLEAGGDQGYTMLERLAPRLEQVADWSAAGLDVLLREVAEAEGVGFGKVAQPVRVAVSGTTVSPSITETLELLGRERTLRRIRRTVSQRNAV